MRARFKMPANSELPDIVAVVRKPPFQRVAPNERRADVRKYTRQYCFVCASLFTPKGRPCRLQQPAAAV